MCGLIPMRQGSDCDALNPDKVLPSQFIGKEWPQAVVSAEKNSNEGDKQLACPAVGPQPTGRIVCRL